MPAYLGDVGLLVPVPGVSALRPSGERAVSYRTTLGGARKAQVGPAPRRQWDVGVSAAARPDELAAVSGFVQGEHGRGPWWWVDPWAQVSNVLPPGVSILDAPIGGNQTLLVGPARLPDGSVAGRHYLLTHNDSWIGLTVGGVFLDLPCVPGVPVTGSWWVNRPGVAVSVIVYDAYGAQVASEVSTAGESGWQRVAATVTPPDTAHHVRLFVHGLSQLDVRITRPAVTWTPAVTPWHVGQGAPKVMLTGMSQDVTLAHVGPRGQLAGASFTVMEVG